MIPTQPRRPPARHGRTYWIVLAVIWYFVWSLALLAALFFEGFEVTAGVTAVLIAGLIVQIGLIAAVFVRPARPSFDLADSVPGADLSVLMLGGSASLGVAFVATWLVVPDALWASAINVGFDACLIAAMVGAWLAWGRRGPEVDDPSVLSAGPPSDLTPCLAVILHDGRAQWRALSVALLELADEGFLTIHDDPYATAGVVMPRAWIQLTRRHGDAAELRGPERVLARHLMQGRHDGDAVDPIDELVRLGEARPEFEQAIDGELVAMGLCRHPPYRTRSQWQRASEALIGVAAVGWIVVVFLRPVPVPVLMGCIGLAFAGLLAWWIAGALPPKTRLGTSVTAMLRAYRRTLRNTLAVAGSVPEAYDVAELAWVRTPNHMIVWAMALGLGSELGDLFARVHRSASGEDAAYPWLPDWYAATVPDPEALFKSFDHRVSEA